MAGKEQFSVRGKTAVITGAARGLGLASAQLLSKIEANIAVLDIITQTKPWSGSTESGVQVEYYKTDITNGQEVTQIIEQIQEAFGSIGIPMRHAS